MPTTSVVFSPELDERALDREVRQTNDAFADAASDLSADFNAEMGGVGGGGVATGDNAMLALADQRNDLLEDIHETLDEDFVGSSQEGGGGGGGGTTIIPTSAGGAAGGAASGAAGGAAGVAGGAAAGLAAGAGIVGLIQSQTDFFERIQSAGASFSQMLGGLNTKRLLGALNLASFGAPQLLSSAGAGLVEGFRGEGIFNVERAKQGFNEVFQTWQQSNSQVISDLQNAFTGLSWPSTPDWMNPFTEWEWPSTPSWMNPFTEWSFPQPPSWVSGLLSIFGGGGGGRSQTRSVISDTPDDQRDPTLARASRENQATDRGGGMNLNNEINVNLDPQRVARDIRAQVEPVIQRELDQIRRDLERGGARGSAPGARN